MKKLLLTTFLFFVVGFSYAQYYTGYYVSDKKVHSFDHFKIKQDKTNDKTHGDLHVSAFAGDKLLWENVMTYVEPASRRNYYVENYGEGREIISVHELKFMWDGNEWEYILLGYHHEDRHRHFIVIEEIFNDESETELKEFNRFDWVRGHRIASGGGRH